MRKKPSLLIFNRIIYSFPIQLMVMYIKKNKSFLFFWLLLFGIITAQLGTKYGLQFLFLNPEYLGKVGFTSFFIVGIMIGLFIVAFNISGFLLNSFRFPFLATLSRTFLKFFLNNFAIPTSFILLYSFRIYQFQSESQLKSLSDISVYLLGLMTGIVAIIFLSLRYFHSTNQDIYKLFGIRHADKDDLLPMRDYSKLDKNRKDAWRVETYLSSFYKIKLVRETGHYQPYMLQKVFRQNHLNAAVFEIVLILLFLSLGFFGESPALKIPAGASVVLVFTILLMLAGVIRYWLKSWGTFAMIALLLLMNFLSQFDYFSPKTLAYGIDNSNPQNTIYSNEHLNNPINKLNFETSINNTQSILNNWKAYWNANGVAKPKLIILEASGGGLRSMLFTFKSLQVIDSTLQGNLMKQTAIIFGSSGGMLSESYYRELYWKQNEALMQDNFTGKQHFIRSLGNDMLNSIIFNGVVADLFLNPKQVKIGNNSYPKDRAYAWEKSFNENTQHLFEHPISDYLTAEKSAQIPMLVISPTILNSGGALHISPQPVSYLLNSNDPSLKQLPNGIEFTQYFQNQQPLNLRMSSALRMNAAFPYITPATTLPCSPSLDVLDAGLHDNYGTQNAVQFIYTFKDWIKNNTSGVILLQIRDTPKKINTSNNSASTFFEKTTGPIKNLSDNFLVTQDYIADKLISNVNATSDIKFDYVLVQMPETKERVSLNWHLTEKEKNLLISGIYSYQNKEELSRIKSLLTSNQ
ncbi:MAG: hypothetical protein ACKOX3_09910 [Bacteroidota bacterium]